MTLPPALVRLGDLGRRLLDRQVGTALGKVRLATLAFGLLESARQMTALSPGVFGVALSAADGYAVVRACSESSGLTAGLRLPLELITAPDNSGSPRKFRRRM